LRSKRRFFPSSHSFAWPVLETCARSASPRTSRRSIDGVYLSARCQLGVSHFLRLGDDFFCRYVWPPFRLTDAVAENAGSSAQETANDLILAFLLLFPAFRTPPAQANRRPDRICRRIIAEAEKMLTPSWQR